jgi:hypothetical protein
MTPRIADANTRSLISFPGVARAAPRNWADLCDSVTDNFRVINPKEFRVMR